MKLYSKITTERASKGQGGNKFLDIEITDDNHVVIGIIKLLPYEDSIGDGIKVHYWFDERLEFVRQEQIPTRGMKSLE